MAEKIILLPDAMHVVEVASVKVSKARSSGNPMLAWRLRVVGGEFAGHILRHHNPLSPGAFSFLERDLKACGVTVAAPEEATAHVDELHGLVLQVRTSVEGEHQRVTFLRRLPKDAAPASRRPAPSRVAGMAPGAFLDDEVLPALYRRLPEAFPQFGFIERSGHWEATLWPAGFASEVEHQVPGRLTVYENRPWWLKIHGHAGVRLVDLVGSANPRGKEYIEAVVELARRAGVDPAPLQSGATPEMFEAARQHEERREALAIVSTRAQQVLWGTEAGAKARTYLCAERKLPEASVKELGFGLYLSVKEMEAALKAGGADLQIARAAGLLNPELIGYVTIPWADERGRPLTIYGRWASRVPPEGKPKTIALPGEGTKSNPLYLDRAMRGAKGPVDLVLVEGVLDAAMGQALGDSRVVATVAAQLNGGQTDVLCRYSSRIRRVFVCGDPDGGGDNGTLANLEALGRIGLESWVVERLPDGCDPDELMVRDGVDAWRSRVEQSLTGSLWLARQALSRVSPDSPLTARRAAIKRGLELYAACRSEMDRSDLLRLLSERTGEPLRTLTKDAQQTAKAVEPARTGAVAAHEFELNDTGNAERLVKAHGEELRHAAGLGWMTWTGARWQRDRSGRVQQLIKGVVQHIASEANDPSIDNDTREAIYAHALHSGSAYARESCARLAASEPGIAVGACQFDADPWLLNVANGTVDLRTGRLCAHRREDLLTRIAGVGRDGAGTPVPYAPDARSELWERCLEQWQPDPEVRAFLARFVGYCLTGAIREHVMVVMHGPQGRNGKSTFANAILSLLGEYGGTVSSGLIMARHDSPSPTETISFMGLRLAVTAEPPDGCALNTALVKQLTGGDTMQGRHLYQDLIEFRPTHKLMLLTNPRPHVRETSAAIWQRLILVPWEAQFLEGDPRQDPNLESKLLSELPGVLGWAVRGCLDWQRTGLAAPQAVRAAVEEYQQDEDHVGRFLAERCVAHPASRVWNSELYKAYTDWCDEEGERSFAQKVFSAQLKARRFANRKNGGRMLWDGVGLLANEPTDQLELPEGGRGEAA